MLDDTRQKQNSELWREFDNKFGVFKNNVNTKDKFEVSKTGECKKTVCFVFKVFVKICDHIGSKVACCSQKSAMSKKWLQALVS